jgi:hypothetical protein
MKRQMQANFRELFQAIKADPQTPFRDIYLLERPDRHYNRHWKVLIDRARAPALRTLSRALHPKRLFLFNEDNLSQYLARHVKASGGAVYAVEDGAAAYSSLEIRYKRTERLKSKLFFGPSANVVKVEGSSRYIDAFFALFPEYLRHELRRNPVKALPTSGLKRLDGLSWPTNYLRRLDLDPNSLRCDTALLLAHSSNFKHWPHYARQLQQLTEDLRSASQRLAVSYHPREKRNDWLNLADHGITLIPQAVPAELIYLFNRHRLRMVYGDIGTSLITSRWLLPNAQVISLMDTLELAHPELKRLFQGIRIQVK